MAISHIIQTWKKKQFKPVYWLEGEEDYYIDRLIHYAEHHLLTPEEAGFNLTVFYGKDAHWADVINACKRYPMFAERQVVILKEAQHMKDIDKLEPYIVHPLASTILVVAYKEKKLDGRTSLAKQLKKHAEVFQSVRLHDHKIPAWIEEYATEKGYQIAQKAVQLLADHIGNDLSRIANELEKLVVNLGTRKAITEDDIETYVGISKEYNVFELQAAIARKDLAKAIQIVQYFESNPKAAPIQLVLPSLYSFFAKTYMLFGLQGDDKTVAAQMGVHPFFLKDYRQAAQLYGYSGVEAALLLLQTYNLRAIGINDANTGDTSLLKELLYKMMCC